MEEYPFIPSFHGIDWEASGENVLTLSQPMLQAIQKEVNSHGKQMSGTMFLGE